MKKINSEEKNNKIRLIVSGIILVVVLAILLFLRLSSVGKAIDAPPLNAIDLDLQEWEEFNIGNFQQWQISMTPSGVLEAQIYNFDISKKGSLFAYRLSDSNEKLLAQGLFSLDYTETGDLYLDNDGKADLRVSFDGTYLKVINKNFIVAKPASINVTDAEDNLIEGTILPATKDEEVIYHFNVSAVKNIDHLSIKLDGATQVEEDVLGTTSYLYDFTFTPTVEKPYIIEFNVTVGGLNSVQKYVLGVNGIFYALVEEDYPNLVLKKNTAGSWDVKFNFAASSKPQPFSLPCGTYDLNSFAEGEVKIVYAYDNGVQQWIKGAPSEFSSLIAGKGYFLLTGNNPITLSYTCAVDVLPPEVLPNLKSGWNFIGVKGKETISSSDFATHIPAGKVITRRIGVSNEAYLNDVEQFEPGKAYWLKVE